MYMFICIKQRTTSLISLFMNNNSATISKTKIIFSIKIDSFFERKLKRLPSLIEANKHKHTYVKIE